jgi:hypothetical protein
VLLLEAAVPDLSKAAEENGSREGIACLNFVEARVNVTAQLNTLQPGEDKQGSFVPAQLAQGTARQFWPGSLPSLRSMREADTVPCSIDMARRRISFQ